MDSKRQYKEFETKVKQLTENLGPFAKKVSNLEKQLVKIEKSSQSEKESYNNLIQNEIIATFKKIEEKETIIQEFKDKLKNISKRQNETCQKITQLEKRIENYSLKQQEYTDKLTDFGLLDENGENLNPPTRRAGEIATELADLTNQMGILEDQKTDLDHQKSAVDREAFQIRQRRGILEDKLRNLNDASQIVFAKLERFHQKDHFKFYRFLQSCQDQFEKPVLGPICTLISVNDERVASIVEDSIGLNTLTSFVMQTHNDYKSCQNKMNQQKIRANLVHLNSNQFNLSQYPKKFSNQELKKYGFEGYLIDYIETLPPVMLVLCKKHNLHSIPFSFAEVDHERILQSGLFNTYYSKGIKYRINKAYGEVSTATSNVKSNEWLSQASIF